MNSYNEVRQALDPAIGVPFKELARELGIALPPDSKKRKAAGGDISEALLDIARNSIPHADLAMLGTEVKTIPLNTLSRPREWTKIKAFNPTAVENEPDFRRSTLFAKLRSILFVPIMKSDNKKPDFWYIRPPFLWLPTEEQLAVLDDDYVALRRAFLAQQWSSLSGRMGAYLAVNTSDVTTKNKPEHQKGRAWWIKATLTRDICAQNLWPRQALQQRKAERRALRESGFHFEPE